MNNIYESEQTTNLLPKNDDGADVRNILFHLSLALTPTVSGQVVTAYRNSTSYDIAVAILGNLLAINHNNTELSSIVTSTFTSFTSNGRLIYNISSRRINPSGPAYSDDQVQVLWILQDYLGIPRWMYPSPTPTPTMTMTPSVTPTLTPTATLTPTPTPTPSPFPVLSKAEYWNLPYHSSELVLRSIDGMNYGTGSDLWITSSVFYSMGGTMPPTGSQNVLYAITSDGKVAGASIDSISYPVESIYNVKQVTFPRRYSATSSYVGITSYLYDGRKSGTGTITASYNYKIPPTPATTTIDPPPTEYLARAMSGIGTVPRTSDYGDLYLLGVSYDPASTSSYVTASWQMTRTGLHASGSIPFAVCGMNSPWDTGGESPWTSSNENGTIYGVSIFHWCPAPYVTDPTLLKAYITIVFDDPYPSEPNNRRRSTNYYIKVSDTGSLQPFPTPTVTPSYTPTPTPTNTVTPTPSTTPTLTPTTSVTPTITPSVTPTISVTPTQTPQWNYKYLVATYYPDPKNYHRVYIQYQNEDNQTQIANYTFYSVPYPSSGWVYDPGTHKLYRQSAIKVRLGTTPIITYGALSNYIP